MNKPSNWTETITSNSHTYEAEILRLRKSIDEAKASVYAHMEPFIESYVNNFDAVEHPSHAEVFIEFDRIKSLEIRCFIYGKIVDGVFYNHLAEREERLRNIKQTMTMHVTPMGDGTIY